MAPPTIDFEQVSVPLRELLRADRAANRGDAKAIAMLTMFRVVQALRGTGARPRLISIPFGIVYKIVCGWLLTVDIPWSIRSPGAGLAMPHAMSTVIHPLVIIGRNVTIKHSVTIGVGGGSGRLDGVPKIGDHVMIGSGAQLLGKIEIGDWAVIGAGAIVTKSVPAGAIAVGNPARHFFRSDDDRVHPNRRSLEVAAEVTPWVDGDEPIR